MPPIYIVIIEMSAALDTVNSSPPMAGCFPRAFLELNPRERK
jgi:hypothetical protein